MSDIKNDEINFGAELFRLRTALRLSQAEVADAAGITRGYYSLIENSRKPPPPLEKVRRIATALRLSPADLRLLWGMAAMERITTSGGESEKVHNGPPGLYVVWNGLVIDIPTEQQIEIEEILTRRKIM
ncbi:helix-turn-helix domain-containing protein [Pseudoduganella sp. DS3]|uniref:Helix-turn-helix domain-containing protein n=1 Tax=Pseudoduganella guangdongensis TaxID=2692179 RepID=A0A6N9HMY2_9BURK|nr:helix-turn-helix transcriptional regulator [Pseudoduganella guangdongensis]MYN04553.1 helix-turn-helix domain-containing protein [Pseudoduganella guangdongensis]